MGMSTYVLAFGDVDETFLKMKTVYETCEKAGVSIPDEVERYFDHSPPRFAPELEIKRSALRDESNPDQLITAIDIADLPPGTKTLWFVNSW